MISNFGAIEDSWESLGPQGYPNQSILKGISPEYSSEGPMLKLKLQYFGHLMWIFRAAFPLGFTGLISLLSSKEFIIAFLPRNKHILISWLQSPSTVILEPKKIKSVTVSIFSPSLCHEVMGPDAIILVFWTLSFKPAFHSPLSSSSRGSLVPLYFLPFN